jgi:enoyl-CoA hydratase/carnithine racemase
VGVTVTHEGTTAIVTLDGPQRRNALGPAEGRELADVLSALADAPGASVVILTGNGAFCAGGDLPAIAELIAKGGPAAIREALYEIFHRIVRSLVRMPVPVLAALDGPAVGLGMDLALACDWRAVGPSGWLRQGWGELGVIPGIGGELLLRRLAPNLIWSLLGSSETLGPDDAARLGLGVSAPDRGLTTALDRAAALAELPEAALRGYVRLHRDGLGEQLDRHLEICLELQVALLGSEEFRRRVERMGNDNE